MKRAALLVAALCALAAAPPAAAKEDVRARLESTIPPDARTGQTIRVTWRLYSVRDGRRRPFGAGGLFVRLRSANGGRATRAYGAGPTGRYTARVKVPRGGIGGIRFGLDGWRIVAGEESYAPVYFPLVNDPFK